MQWNDYASELGCYQALVDLRVCKPWKLYREFLQLLIIKNTL